MDQAIVIEATRRWISSLVIGLNLCPFAQRVFKAETIRYVVSLADEENALLRDLAREMEALTTTPISDVETTLLIHPRVLGNFLDYNAFLDAGDRLIEELGLRGVLQIASFHPAYQFADTEPDAAENYTNRSPYPMLHLLREASISEVATDPDELLAIPQRNIELLRELGKAKIQEKLRAVEEGLPRQT